MKLSIIIVNWDTRELLKNCLNSLRIQDLSDTEIFVIDNGSQDGSFEMVSEHYTEIILLRNQQNEYFSKACNQGIAHATGEYVLLLNSDVELKENSVNKLVKRMENDANIAAVVPMLVDQTGATLSACKRFPTLKTTLFYHTSLGRIFPNNKAMYRYYLRDWAHKETCYVEQPPACCFLIRKRVFEHIGVFDEAMPLFFSDVDLCKRMQEHNYPVLYLSEAQALHHVGGSTKKLTNMLDMYYKDRICYYRKYFGKKGAWLCKLMLLDLLGWEAWKAFKQEGIKKEFWHFYKI